MMSTTQAQDFLELSIAFEDLSSLSTPKPRFASIPSNSNLKLSRRDDASS